MLGRVSECGCVSRQSGLNRIRHDGSLKVEWGWRLADGGGARRQAGVLVASPAKLGKGKHTASRLQIATTMHESFMVNSLAHGAR